MEWGWYGIWYNVFGSIDMWPWGPGPFDDFCVTVGQNHFERKQLETV